MHKININTEGIFLFPKVSTPFTTTSEHMRDMAPLSPPASGCLGRAAAGPYGC